MYGEPDIELADHLPLQTADGHAGARFWCNIGRNSHPGARHVDDETDDHGTVVEGQHGARVARMAAPVFALVEQRTHPVPLDPVDLCGKPQTLVFARRDSYGKAAFDTPDDLAPQDAEFLQMGGNGFVLFAADRRGKYRYKRRNALNPTREDLCPAGGAISTARQSIMSVDAADKADVLAALGAARNG